MNKAQLLTRIRIKDSRIIMLYTAQIHILHSAGMIVW